MAEILEAAEMCGLNLIKNRGDEVIALCPFCNDRSGHLYLNPDKNAYHCVRCGEGGYAVGMVAKIMNVSRSEAARMLNEKTRWIGIMYRERYKIKLPRTEKKESNDNMAPIEIRDKVYSIFLDILELSDKHKKNFLQRGLPEHIIEKNGYKTLATDPFSRKNICRYLSKAFDLTHIPGFYKEGDSWDYIDVEGFIIPVRDRIGRIQGLQIRKDDDTKGKYVWFSASSKGGQKARNFVHVAYGRKKGVAVITEGPLKADIASYYTGYTFIAVPGVSSWRESIKVLQQLPFINKVFVAFDMDYKNNPAVEKCMRDLYNSLVSEGYKTEILEWDASIGKGIDDYVVRISRR